MAGTPGPVGGALGPVTLEGKYIRLEPMRPNHAQALLQAAQAPQIWTWMSAEPTKLDTMRDFISAAMEAEAKGQEYAFTVLIKAGGRVVGSTRYMDVQPDSRGVEIGWAWDAPDNWGTVVNAEAKYLLLEHAFENWKAIRVALKTDALNIHSQAAIKKLGAKFEGVLRHHRIRRDGTLRDSVMFSIIESEWPEVKAALARRIEEAKP